MELEAVVADLIQKMERRFYGKYRGFVVNADDPKHLGRVMLRVPSVLGPDVVTGWAMPCVPSGGQPNQGFLFVPEIGAGVWVEFEEGDLEFPIWVGTFWSEPGGKSEIPTLTQSDGTEQPNDQKPPTRKIIKTRKGHTIQFEDADAKEMVVIIEATHGHIVSLDGSGVRIKDGVGGHEITMGKAGIRLGGSDANEPFVLGGQFLQYMKAFIKALNAHTHGGAGTPPATPLELPVPLSAKHRVE